VDKRIAKALSGIWWRSFSLHEVFSSAKEGRRRSLHHTQKQYLTWRQ